MATTSSRAHTHVKNLQPLVVNPNAGAGTPYTPPFGQPAKPTITNPTNGSGTNGQIFTLSAYSHPNAVEQRSLQVQRSTNSGFTANLLINNPTLNTTNGVTLEVLPTLGITWYARARYIDSFGQPSEWSDTVSFTAVSAPEVKAQARSGSSSAASHSLTFTGAAIGDLIILLCAANATPTTPSGFTQQTGYTSVLSGSNVYVYTKVATANNESVTFTTAGAGDVMGVALRYATAYPPSGSLAQAKTATTTMAVPVPSGGAGKFALTMGFCRSPSSSITMPSGAGWNVIYNLASQSGSGYFAPLIAWTNSLAAGTISRVSATYEAWFITYQF